MSPCDRAGLNFPLEKRKKGGYKMILFYSSKKRKPKNAAHLRENDPAA
jgi:hypothetical protein